MKRKFKLLCNDVRYGRTEVKSKAKWMKFATPVLCVSLLITPDRHKKMVTRIRIFFAIVGHEDGCC